LVISEAEEESVEETHSWRRWGSIGDPLAIRARGAPSHAIAGMLGVSRRTAG